MDRRRLNRNSMKTRVCRDLPIRLPRSDWRSTRLSTAPECAPRANDAVERAQDGCAPSDRRHQLGKHTIMYCLHEPGAVRRTARQCVRRRTSFHRPADCLVGTASADVGLRAQCPLNHVIQDVYKLGLNYVRWWNVNIKDLRFDLVILFEYIGLLNSILRQ